MIVTSDYLFVMRERLNEAKARFRRGASPLPTVRVDQAHLELALNELDELRQKQRDRDREARRRVVDL